MPNHLAVLACFQLHAMDSLMVEECKRHIRPAILSTPCNGFQFLATFEDFVRTVQLSTPCNGFTS